MPNFNYTPTINEIIMMFTKALKYEQAERRKSVKGIKIKRKSGLV